MDSALVALNNSQISANAFGGPGGNVRITADAFLVSTTSSVTASSTLSTPGTIDIQAPITDLSGSLAPLPEAIVQATALLHQSCVTRFAVGKPSSLVATGREGLPWEPGSFMPSSLERLQIPADSSRAHESQSPQQQKSTADFLAVAKLAVDGGWDCGRFSFGDRRSQFILPTHSD